jgi:hypothetical protein
VPFRQACATQQAVVPNQQLLTRSQPILIRDPLSRSQGEPQIAKFRYRESDDGVHGEAWSGRRENVRKEAKDKISTKIAELEGVW